MPRTPIFVSTNVLARTKPYLKSRKNGNSKYKNYVTEKHGKFHFLFKQMFSNQLEQCFC